jgi:hypothetical protein
VRHEAIFCIHWLLVKELVETVDWHRGAVEDSSLRVDWYLPTFRYIAVPSSAGSSSLWTAHRQREELVDVSLSWGAFRVGRKTIKRCKSVYRAVYNANR